jgi:hypothetical protein
MSKKFNSQINNTIHFNSIINNVKNFTSTISNSKYFVGILDNFTQVNTLYSHLISNVILSTENMRVFLNNNINLIITTPITFTYLFIQDKLNIIITNNVIFTTGFTTFIKNQINFIGSVNFNSNIMLLYRQILNMIIGVPFTATAQVKRMRTLGEWDSYTLGQLDAMTLDQIDYETS